MYTRFLQHLYTCHPASLCKLFFGEDMVFLLFFIQLFPSIDLKGLQTSEHHSKTVQTSAPSFRV